MRFEPTGAGWQAQTDPLCYDGRHSNFSYVNLCSFYISKNNNTTQLSLNCAFGKWYLHKILCLVQLCKLMFYVLMFFNVSPEICWQKTFMTFSLGSSLQLLVVNWKKFPCKLKVTKKLFRFSNSGLVSCFLSLFKHKFYSYNCGLPWDSNQIVRVEAKYADHLTTTTGLIVWR